MDFGRAGVWRLGWGLLVLATGCSVGRGSGSVVADARKKPPMFVASRAPALPVTTRVVGLSSGSESPLDHNSADRFAPPRYPTTHNPALKIAGGREETQPTPRWDAPERRLPAVEDTQDIDP